MIYLGNKAVKNVFLGDRPVARIYKGSDLVWEKAPEPGYYDEDFQAVIDEATSLGYTIPETKYLNLLNDAVVACKDSGIFQKADLLLFFATGSNEDTDFKSINYKNPSHKASLINLEISRHGVVGVGTDSYINTLYNPATMGDNYTLNNAGRASWVFKLFSDSESPVTHAVLDSANANTNMVDLNISGSHRINSGTMGLNSGTFNMGGLGFKGINRINSEDLTLYNGKTRGNNSRTSSGITNAFQFVLRRGTNYGTSGISFYYMGAALTEQESNDFSDLISNLLSSIGPTAPLLSRNNIEVVSGGIETVSATGEAGTTIVWKDSLGGVIHTGDTLTIPTSVNGQFSYFAYAVNEDDVESEPSVFSVLVRSVDDLVLLTPTDTYIESTDTLVIKNISPSSVTIEYYDDSDNIIQTDGDLTLSGLTVGTHSYYAVPKSGVTTFNPVDITVRVLEEFPEVDSSEYFTLTIVDGIPDEHIIYNEEVQPFKTRVFAKNTVVNNIYLENPNYVFSPRATSVIMDSDKTITFTPTTV